MPLKHATETILVCILGLATVLAGIVLSILPPLGLSIVPWLVLFGLTLVYPLVLYPLLRSRRADYPFRLLHFVPACMALLWLVFDVLSSYLLAAEPVLNVYTWGWTFLAVIVAFFLIVWFCLSVIRQRVTRIGLLALILVPFAALAFTAERRQWPDRMASALWPRMGIGSEIAFVPDADRNTDPSDNADEEEWRAEMRRMDRRNRRLRDSGGELTAVLPGSQSSSSSSAASVQVLITVSSSSSSAFSLGASSSEQALIAAVPSSVAVSSQAHAWQMVTSSAVSSTTVVATATGAARMPWYRAFFGGADDASSSSAASSTSSSVSSVVMVATKPPPKLSSSGPGEIAGIGLLFAAGYCGLLHRRAMRRKV
jgi:hypothetical protein